MPSVLAEGAEVGLGLVTSVRVHRKPDPAGRSGLDTTFRAPERMLALNKVVVDHPDACRPVTPDRSRRAQIDFLSPDSLLVRCRLCPDPRLIASLPADDEVTRPRAVEECVALDAAMGWRASGVEAPRPD